MAKSPELYRKLLMEGIGTFLLVFIGAGSIISSSYFSPGASQIIVVALAHGLALAIAVTLAMAISGGHINPAVTIGMFVAKRIKAADAVAYILAQVVGAYIGAALLFLIMPSSLGAAVGWGAPALSSSVTVFQGILIEMAITFILVMSVFGTAVDPRAPKIGGFGIGLTLMMCILVAGPLTGAAANPARAIGPMFVTYNFTNWYVYWIGPILGGILAALIYQYIILKK